MTFRLSALADRDLKAIAAHVAEDDANAARGLLLRIDERMSRLLRFPELGRRRLDIGEHVRGLLISPYVAIYRIDSAGIVILRVVHSSRDLREIVLQ